VVTRRPRDDFEKKEPGKNPGINFHVALNGDGERQEKRKEEEKRKRERQSFFWSSYVEQVSLNSKKAFPLTGCSTITSIPFCRSSSARKGERQRKKGTRKERKEAWKHPRKEGKGNKAKQGRKRKERQELKKERRKEKEEGSTEGTDRHESKLKRSTLRMKEGLSENELSELLPSCV